MKQDYSYLEKSRKKAVAKIKKKWANDPEWREKRIEQMRENGKRSAYNRKMAVIERDILLKELQDIKSKTN